MPDSLSLAQLRAQHARAVRAFKRHPSETTSRAIDETLRAYTEAKLTDYIATQMATWPPLTEDQLDRLALLLRSSGDAP